VRHALRSAAGIKGLVLCRHHLGGVFSRPGLRSLEELAVDSNFNLNSSYTLEAALALRLQATVTIRVRATS
jgi:hypothetical protein